MTTVRDTTPNRYADLGDVRRALNIDEKRSHRDDALLEDFIEVSSRSIDNFCERDFSTWDAVATPRIFELSTDGGLRRSRYARGRISQVFTNDFMPPTPDDPIVVETAELPIGQWAPIDADSFWTDPMSPVNEPCWGVSLIGSGGRDYARITARWGWGEYVPAPVSRATIMLASRLYKRQDSPLGVTPAVSELGTMIVRRDMDIMDLLRPYRSFALKMP